MAIEKVREYFKQTGFDGEILEFEVSSATVALAALAVGTQEARIAKSLSFMADNVPILIVVAGDVKIDNQKYKSEFHTKAKMLSAQQVTELIGHSVGGVCPFGINKGVKVFLDESLKRFETVFPACGSSNSAIELEISQLEELSKYEKWVNVCKQI